MATVSQPGYYNLQALTSLGALGVGMRLYTYVQGTTTHKVAYTESTGTTAQTYTSDGAGGQYIALDARGELPSPLYLTGGAYDLALKTPAGATVWTRRADPQGDASLAHFLPAGTGATTRTVQAKLRESVSVLDFGATGDGSTDDTAAIQAAIDANPGRTIFFPDPASSYKITAPIYVRTDRTTLEGESAATFVYQTTANTDAIVFEPTTAGSTSAFLNSPQIRTMAVANTASGTATGGTCIKFRQCNGYRLFNINTTSQGCLEGISVYGGQFGSLKSFTCSSSAGGYAGDGTALLTFRRAVYASSRQACYTTEIEDSRITASLLRGSAVRISDCDGLHFTNGYWGNGKNALVHVEPEADGDYVAALSFVNVYMDCVNTSSTINGVIIPDDGLATSAIYDVKIGAGCFIGNGSGHGILAVHPRLYLLDVTGASVANMTGYGIHSTASNTTYRTLKVTGCRIQNNDGGGIYADGGRILSIVGNSFTDNLLSVITLAGTFVSGTIAGNSSPGTVSELVNGATFSAAAPLKLAANVSAHTGTDSWGNLGATASLNFGSLTVGAQETLTISVPGAVVGDNVIGNAQSNTNAAVVAGGAMIAFFYGVTAANTVSVRAINIGTATGDVGALTFKVAIVR